MILRLARDLHDLVPRNELNCTVILLIGFRVLVFHWDLYYTTVALFYISQQVLGLVFWGAIGDRVMVIEMGHLSGAFWGAIVAMRSSRRGLVDCEDWDIFSLRRKRAKLALEWNQRGQRLDREKQVLPLQSQGQSEGQARRPRRNHAEGRTTTAPAADERRRRAVRAGPFLIDKGDIAGVMTAHEQVRPQPGQLGPRNPHSLMIKAFSSAGGGTRRDPPDAGPLPLLTPEASTRVRLKLAQILIRDRQRPAAAPGSSTSSPRLTLRRPRNPRGQKLTLQANRMCEDGVLEP